jgi:hypothetical protein
MEIIFVFSRVGGEVEEQLVRHGIFTNTLIGSPKGTVEISEVTEIPSCATSFSGGVFALVTGCTKLFPPPSAFETQKGSPDQSPEAILCRNRYQRRPWSAKVAEVVEVVEVVKIVQVHTTVRQFDQRRPLRTPGRFLCRLARDGGGRGTKLQKAQSKKSRLLPSLQSSRQVVLLTEAMALPSVFGDEVCCS